MQDMQKCAYPKKKRKSVTGQFAAVKYRSEMYCWTQKLNREGYGVDKYCILFFFERGQGLKKTTSRLRFEISRLRSLALEKKREQANTSQCVCRNRVDCKD